MLRSVRVLALGLAAMLFGNSAATAQASTFLFAGGGATIPTGDFKDFGGGDGAKTGYLADVGIGRSLGSSGRMFAFADIFYGKNNHDTTDESTTLTGGGLNLGVQSSGSSARVYGYLGGGLQNHKYNPASGDSESDTNFFGRGAVGISLGASNTTFWAEAGLVQGLNSGEKTAYFPILAGVTINW